MPPPARAAAGGGDPAPAAPAKRRSPVNAFSITLAAGCAALAASGAVPARHLAFSALFPAYLAAANTLRFASNASHRAAPRGALVPEPWVPRYAGAAALLALALPAIVSAAAFATGDAPALRAVAPHLYLTAAQVVCEFFTGGPNTAMLVRMLVPIGFNTYRMWALAEWCAAAAARGPWHVALAVANTAFWAYNLFIFLLLKMVPLYLNPSNCAV